MLSLSTVVHVSPQDRPTFMEPAKAGRAIEARVDPRAPLTVADAAAKAGLALRDAENGGGSQRIPRPAPRDERGELVHLFPTGFAKPWETRDALRRARKAASRALASTVRFLVRAWVAVVLVGYAAVFVGLILAMTFARQGNDSRRNDDGLPGGALAAFFASWATRCSGPSTPGRRSRSTCSAQRVDPGHAGRTAGLAREPQVRSAGASTAFSSGRPRLRRIRARANAWSSPPSGPARGRIGLADVMRVTGLPREQARPLMSRLLLDYEGDVDVGEEGGIVYRFAAIRKTASEAVEPSTRRRGPGWKSLPPLTGNSAGARTSRSRR